MNRAQANTDKPQHDTNTEAWSFRPDSWGFLYLLCTQWNQLSSSSLFGKSAIISYFPIQAPLDP